MSLYYRLKASVAHGCIAYVFGLALATVHIIYGREVALNLQARLIAFMESVE